jgi:hypothetical protein
MDLSSKLATQEMQMVEFLERDYGLVPLLTRIGMTLTESRYSAWKTNRFNETPKPRIHLPQMVIRQIRTPPQDSGVICNSVTLIKVHLLISAFLLTRLQLI